MRSTLAWLPALIALAGTGCLLTTDLGGLAESRPTGDASAPTEGGPAADARASSADADADASDAAADAPAACDLDKPFNARVPLGNVNTERSEGGPRLSPDELTLYFESDRAGGPGQSDIWVTTRASRAAPFAAPTLLANVNAAGDEYTATALPNGLALALASNRDGDFAVFLATRPTTSAPFGAPAKIAALDTPSIDAHPAFTPAGDALYFTSNRPGGAGGLDLYRAESGADGFGAPVRLAELSGPTDDITPVVAADELSIIFSREVGAKHDIFIARRASRAAPWLAPQRMDDVSTDDDEYSGWMSPDSCRLYLYARGSGGNLDIFVADRSR
jgi:hypothetical protein